ncbi:aldo/keto reductase [Rhizobium sp.]|uniref:aldo/keto reductase n=1 Tax=Rhizobium sp. TaxID=391 RepID=UPI0028B22F5A
MKLALGTVQFGMPYGIANGTGQPNEAVVASILEKAMAAGVAVLDTASLYGEAEAVLGRCLPASHTFRIITKTPKFAGVDGATAADRLEAAFDISCTKLRTVGVAGLMAHDADDLIGPSGDAIWRRMTELRDAGQVARIGASVYSGRQIDALLDRYQPDLVQLPLSILDQRLIEGGHLERLAARCVEVHSRSAFLQGALLMGPDRLPAHLRALGPALEEIAGEAQALGSDPMTLALKFVAGLDAVSAVVCGVDSLSQFEQLVQAISRPDVALLPDRAAALACSDPLLLDPSRWNRS